jgi:hypothetical protein
MTRFLNWIMRRRTLGATASMVFLAACIVEERTPEVCDPALTKRYAKCTPPAVTTVAPDSAERGIEY